ncbi:uncharacterized protein LOC100120052 isoform X2 [Nasonia vitripennis]|uniref:RRM domain-containing protein n=1 Tax=Nasonia vitripennis TaxID=7425 RepID=A0A7M7HCJ9_NASVI|nr:uncharacterized protein LOC100120052 isoform X2 [Nasonia vitripennis]
MVTITILGIMVKPKRLDKTRMRRRTSLEIEEEQSRTLYIRLPHTIKDEQEIKDLFFGDIKLKIPRQSARYCHVIFPNVEEKLKNMKALKKKLVDGKPIYAGPPKPINLEKKKKPKQKKIVVPDPTDDPKLGKYLFVSNIPAGVKASEIKDAFPGSRTVALIKGLVNGKRLAKVKMSSTQLCQHYVNNESEWPSFRDTKCSITFSKNVSNSKNKKKKPKNKSKPLKIYDGETEVKNDSKSPKKSKVEGEAEDVDETLTDDEDDVEKEDEVTEEENDVSDEE